MSLYDHYSIGYDADFQTDAFKSVDIIGVESEREIPCDTCPMAAECESKMLDCMAARNWFHGGDFEDANVGRLRRACK